MKKNFVAIAAAALLCLSCNNDPYTPTPDPVFPDPSLPSNVEVYADTMYSQAGFCNFLGESFDDYLDYALSKELNVLIKPMVKDIFNDNSAAVDSTVAEELDCSVFLAHYKWGVKVYNYSYPTISHTGTPIRLSAALCVPTLYDEEETHCLDAMSLCPPHMPIYKEVCPTVNGTILMNRVSFNHAVVVPDYQGRGIYTATPYSSLHTHDHAQQAIDAALAARTILEEEGYAMKDDFALYNVGVSEGGEVAYETQKMIENDITSEQREKLNLKLSFGANGITQHSLYIVSQMSIYEYVDEESHKIEMGFFKDAFDNFTEAEKQGWTGEDLYSKDLLDENGKIKLDHPIIKVMQEAVKRNDITYNWNPQHPLTLAASTDDNDVLYVEHFFNAYQLLKNAPDGSVNENVKLMSFRTPVSKEISDLVGPDLMFAHIAADICGFVHAIKYEDPGSEPITIPWAE